MNRNLFQFPSNGKVYSEAQSLASKNAIISFNSLQTGKCIQSQPTSKESNSLLGVSFERSPSRMSETYFAAARAGVFGSFLKS